MRKDERNNGKRKVVRLAIKERRKAEKEKTRR